MTATEERRVVIVLEGGIIQNIEGIPPGIVLEVRDFDTEGAIPHPNLRRIGGELAFVNEWRAQDTAA